MKAIKSLQFNNIINPIIIKTNFQQIYTDFYDDSKTGWSHTIGHASILVLLAHHLKIKYISFGKIAEKARRHAQNNPYALFNKPLSLEEIMNSPPVFDPLTRLQCCPPTCGAAAAILCSADFAKRHGHNETISIKAQAMRTDFSSSFSDSMIKMVGFDMAEAAANDVYEQSGISPKDVDVVELHDCFTTNELLSYEALQLCEKGAAEQLFEIRESTLTPLQLEFATG